MKNLSRLIEFIIKCIFRQRCSSSYEWEGKPFISLDDAVDGGWLSQCYQEVSLTKLHSTTVRVLATSKCIWADQEVKQAIDRIPELSGYDLKNGDPGLYLITKRMLRSVDEADLPNPYCIVLESEHELEQIIRTTCMYSFYKRYKKKMPTEFAAAERDMRGLVEQYHIPGRFSWNSFVGNAKPKREKVDMTFLNEYGTASPAKQLAQSNS